MERIVSTGQELVDQAVGTTAQYFDRAVAVIDAQFGEGYAEKHPELVAIVIQTQTADFTIAVLGSIFQDFTEDLTSSLSEIAAARSFPKP